MEKGGEVRRGGGGGGGGGGSRLSTAKAKRPVSSEKSKKEKVRSLSAVAKELSSYQMGCHLSHKPNNVSPSSAKRFKLPRKRQSLNGCNGVDHAPVPRKIRSAMKKRSRESILSDSEKVNHKINGIESPEKAGIKKSKKQGSPGWSTKEAVCGAITKDEEEVVETLYALAGMFPDNGSSARTELECESLPEKSLALQDPEESANATFEASGTTQDASPCPERSPKGATKISSSNEATGQEQSDFPESANFLVASHTHSNAPKINLQAMPTMVKSENGSKFALHDSELCLAMGLNMPRQTHISHIGRKPFVEFQMAGSIDCKQDQPMIKNQKETEGLAWWPGLSLRASAGVNASYLQSSAAKAPDRVNAAFCTSKQDFMESCSSGGRISKVGIHKKSWKRCAAHVRISHLIQSLEMSKRQITKETELNECQQMRVHQGSNMEVHSLNGMRNGISSAFGTVNSATAKNSHETTNGILQQLCHYQGMSQSQGLPTPVVDGPQKQSFNFLSLSAGGNGLKVNDSFNKVGSRSEPLSKLQVPYFQSLQQQHGLMPIPTPQIQYASASYLDRLPVAGPQVRLQQPHYYGSPSCGSHYRSTVSNNQHHQSFWAMQVASQGRSAENCNTIVRAQYHPNWQSGRHNSSAAQAQVILPPHSPVSLEALGSKLTAVSEQHLFALPSSSSINGLDIHFPSACEEGRFRSTGTPSLQLLCDERI